MRQAPLDIKFVIPAAPGFFSLALLFDESDQIAGASKEPIVGWAVDQFNIVCPMTPDTVDADALATLNPDGTVQDPTGTWDSLDDWLSEQKATRA